MRIATFKLDGRRQVGRVSDDGSTVTPFAIGESQAAAGVLSLIDEFPDGRVNAQPSGEPIAIASVELEAPVPVPIRNIWCVGRNYHAHAKELSESVFKASSAKTDEWPIVFTKVPECVVGPFANVEIPVGISEQIDYEAELAVVIGKAGKNIRKEDALAHVFGYTVINDVTARDVQMRHQQWDMGKSFDTFCPMGPWVATADDFDALKSSVRSWVNGELRQDAPVENMIFDIPTLIETISRGITLYPGDVIATGTPAGVGMGMKPPVYLKAGDVVRVEVEGLGSIENRFI